MSHARDFRSFSLHLAVYSVLLLIYFLLVLRYLTRWLNDLFQYHRAEFAAVAILLMIVQAVVLESVSHFILKLFRGKKG